MQTAGVVSHVDEARFLKDKPASPIFPHVTHCLRSRHTTTAVVINENEERLMNDISKWLGKLAPADGAYLHNDIQ